MPRWYPKPFWKDQDVYIIGGGTSLRSFDWERLRGKNTIGCNSAFTLGEDICNICIFGDIQWWENSRKELEKYKGKVVTNCQRLQESDCPWLNIMRRIPQGISDEALGWNSNTGASAINLAIILGAKRIYLLGFDMKMGKDDNPNWHERRFETAHSVVYQRFIEGFNSVYKDWKEKYSDREIYNITDDSDLSVFPKIALDQHFREGACCG